VHHQENQTLSWQPLYAPEQYARIRKTLRTPRSSNLWRPSKADGDRANWAITGTPDDPSWLSLVYLPKGLDIPSGHPCLEGIARLATFEEAQLAAQAGEQKTPATTSFVQQPSKQDGHAHFRFDCPTTEKSKTSTINLRIQTNAPHYEIVASLDVTKNKNNSRKIIAQFMRSSMPVDNDRSPFPSQDPMIFIMSAAHTIALHRLLTPIKMGRSKRLPAT
jgi:hypothetical protein